MRVLRVVVLQRSRRTSITRVPEKKVERLIAHEESKEPVHRA